MRRKETMITRSSTLSREAVGPTSVAHMALHAVVAITAADPLIGDPLVTSTMTRRAKKSTTTLLEVVAVDARDILVATFALAASVATVLKEGIRRRRAVATAAATSTELLTAERTSTSSSDLPDVAVAVLVDVV